MSEPVPATPDERIAAMRLACTLLTPFTPPLTLPELAADEAKTTLRHLHEFVAFHGVRPSLLKVLLGQPDLPPAYEGLRAELARFQVGHRFSVMQKTSEIVDLARSLDAEGIAALFFKGAMLGEQVYGGAQYRQFNDIDVLLAPADKDRAMAVLSGLGYVADVPDPQIRRRFFDYFLQHTFRHRDSGTSVDLHWGFVGTGPFPITTAEALAERTHVLLAGTSIPVPAPEALALILAGHGHKEDWASFSWVLDFARFTAAHPELDWGSIAARARRQQCLAPLLSATWLTGHLFGHCVDPTLAELAAREPGLAARCKAIVSRLTELWVRNYGEDFMGGFRLCETPTQKLGMAISLLTTPTIGDYQFLRLPRQLWWSYRLLRPLRLVRQRLRSVHRN